MIKSEHTPVLLQQVIEALAVQPGGRYIDCTIGSGGHALAILEHSSPGGQLLGIDADPNAIAVSQDKLSSYSTAIRFVNDNFINLLNICIKYDFRPVHGILLDLGLSSPQLASNRGFSFQTDSVLDKTTAADLINNLTEAELDQLILKYGEEHQSHRIAHSIVQRRPIHRTSQLVKAIEQVVINRRGRIHPATKTFQALRIAVNHELENLELVLTQAIDLLGYEGRLVVMSYHSLEDRIVKNIMRREAHDCICAPELPTCTCNHSASLRFIKKRVITPSLEEIQLNPRSRSARLRVAEHINVHDTSYKALEKLCNEMEGKTRSWRRPALLKRLQQVYLTP
jgi:16S rRNA (cytosine1402-N4)-methyltransferase